ncbi:unnamed protein product [Paramecium octaurelia]|uniref:Uncharacterized protein n=1 Tax=Paramecium octaurelia TaxID=43137 RepID=A0A8S1WQ06_PAROT|nr:unnamed protein product [Paramecium octaurelia]
MMDGITKEVLEPSINGKIQLVQKCEGDTDKIQITSTDKYQESDSFMNNQEDDCGFGQQLEFHDEIVQVVDIFDKEFVSAGEVLSKNFEEINLELQNPPNYGVGQESNNKYQQIFNYGDFDDDQNCSQQEHEMVNIQNNLVSTKVYTKIPGETKNLPKCLARRIQDYITTIVQDSEDPELKNTLNNPEIKRFLDMKPEKISKQKLDLFIQSDIGSIFCKEFFGNCLWSYGITKEGKTNVETCFRYNIQYFTKTIKKRKLN